MKQRREVGRFSLLFALGKTSANFTLASAHQSTMVEGVTKRRSSRNTCQPSRYRAGSDLPTEFQDLVHTAAQVRHPQHSRRSKGHHRAQRHSPIGLSCHRPTVSQVTSPRANPSSASWQEAVNKSTHTFDAVRLSHRVATSSTCLTRVPLVLASGRCRCTGGSAGAHAGGAVQPGTGAREEERPGGDHGGGLEGG